MRETSSSARAATAAITLIVLAGCGGAGTGRSLPVAAAPQAAAPLAAGSNLALTVFIPGRAPAAAQRAPKYVGASTQGLVLTQTPAGSPAVTTYADVSSASPLCTPSGGGRTCTIGLTITPGVASSFSATAYDAPVTGSVNGYGTGITAGGKVVSLTTGTPVSVTPVATSVTQVNLVLQPVLGSVIVTSPHAVIVPGGPSVTPAQATFSTTIAALDVDGNRITGAGGNFVTATGASAQAQGVGAATGNAVLVGLSATAFTGPSNDPLTMNWEYSQGQSGTPFAPLTPSFVEIGVSAGAFRQSDQIEVDPLWVDQQALTVATGSTGSFTQYLVADTGSTPSIPAIPAGTICKNGSGATIATLQAAAAGGDTAGTPASAPVTVTPVASGVCTFAWHGSVLDKKGETVNGNGPAVTITVP